ncbi:Gp15 family bacteriophage protein [Mammaliicoccus sciuri]
MRLNDKLITSFVYEDQEYDIDLTFDNVLDVLDVFEDNELRDNEKAEIGLALLLDDQDYQPSMELWNHIYQSFIHVGHKQPIEYDRKGNPMPVRKEKQTTDLDKDAEHIYASFLQAYNINLFKEQGKLHWHEFQSLLHGLPAVTIMQRIVQIRLWEPSKGDSAEHKKVMQDLQKVYQLNDEDVEEVE